MFTRRTNTQPQAHYVQHGQQQQAHYGNYPPSHDQGAPGYYSNPDYPNYPPI